MRAHAIALRRLFCVALLNIRIAMVSSKCASAFDNSFSTPMSRDGLGCVAPALPLQLPTFALHASACTAQPKGERESTDGPWFIERIRCLSESRDTKRCEALCAHVHARALLPSRCRRMETTTRPIARALNRGIPNRASLTFFWDATCGRLRCLWQLRSSLWL